MGIVFSASFFLAGELGYMGHKGDCPLLYSVLDITGLGLLLACGPDTGPSSSNDVSLAGNRML